MSKTEPRSSARRASSALRENVQQMLGTLTAQECGILLCAALLGFRFEHESVASAVGAQPGAVMSALRRMARRNILVEEAFEHCSFRFSHELIREALLDLMPSSAARTYHRAITAALEMLPAASGRVTELAHHSWEGGMDDKAAVYCERAGDEANEMLARSEAAYYYGRALSVAGSSDKERLLVKIANLRGQS